MSFRNQKDAFSINNMTRLNDDYTEKESKIRNNQITIGTTSTPVNNCLMLTFTAKMALPVRQVKIVIDIR